MELGGKISFGNCNTEVSDIYDMKFYADKGNEGKPLYEQAEIKITLDDDAWSKWASGGYQSLNFEVKREDCHQLVVKGNPAVLYNFSFPPAERNFMTVSFNFNTKEVAENKKFDYHVIQGRQVGDNIIVGGETYHIERTDRNLFEANSGQDKQILKSDSVELSAFHIGEAAIYNWYNPQGQLIYSGQNMTVSPDVTTKYKLEIIAEVDGYISYDSVTVNVKPSGIKKINPNPTSAFTTIDYVLEDGTTSAYMEIFNSSNSTSNNYILDVNQGTTNVNLSSFNTGSYIVFLICNGQVRDQQNLIVIH